MDTTEQADDVRAEAERIIQRRRDAAAAKRKAERPITNSELSPSSTTLLAHSELW